MVMEPQALQGPEKLHQVTQLLDTLQKDLDQKYLTSAQREQILLQLRQHGTNPQNADPIYSKNGIGILAKYGADGESANVRRAALRCIANALLFESKLRQVFVDTGSYGKLAERLKCDSEDELVISRLLLYATFDGRLDFEKLANEHSLADNILYQISRHTKQFPKSGKKTLSQVDELAFMETIKLLANIATMYPDLTPLFSPAIPSILKVISRLDIPTEPLDGLMYCLINCLSTLDLKCEKSKPFESSPFFPKFNHNCNVDKLINVLDKAISSYPAEDLNIKAIPLLQTLRVIHNLAPEGPRQYMKWLLLPDDRDRSQPIGHSDTLSSRLLRLSTSPYTNLKAAISELIFALSDNNAENLTRNIGFGFASGLLASRGMQMPQTAGEAFADGLDPAINPITGQRFDAEPVDTGPSMTKAEKEREAERLFVLFERAKANGFINVENPVAQALHEGRLEELPDSDDSD